MKLLKEFLRGDGAHCGLADWYPEQRPLLKQHSRPMLPLTLDGTQARKKLPQREFFQGLGKKV